ncbi:hypothetical protein J2Z23_003048 [Lederbergia galactosidilyticus]|nr:hypothetical protein [Lederbergia galactosidilytica]
MYNGQQTLVNIGSPSDKDILKQMNQIVIFIHNALPNFLT